MKLKLFGLFFFIFSCYNGYAQDIALYQQFNGRYDYTAIGNTLNTSENGSLAVCDILTSSSANLDLDTNQTIIAAYLYWAGSGDGDFEVSLNNNIVTAERTFSDSLDDTRVFFAAFADVTTIVLEEGNTLYTLSEFDITDVIAPYCPTGTNFGGWALTVIYEDDALPLNQLNVYDGLQSVPESLTITLDNLNVLDNDNAKIGFIAWEGDRALAVNEQLTINGNLIGNPPLNPSNNAFNGTNSFTGATDLFNMDIDVYNIQDNIAVGDTSATISLTSGQDFVMINNIITVLNSQLPDATIVIDSINLECDSRTIEVEYTVNNTNSTGVLENNTPIAFYANTTLIGQSQTNSDIPIGGSEVSTITLEIPETIPDEFILTVIVDDDGSGNGIITETNENNNSDFEDVALLIIPEILILPNLIECNLGFEKAFFNLLEATENNIQFENSSFQFYTSLEDLKEGINSIPFPEDFENESNPQTIYIRLEKDICYEIFQFNIETENCPPEIPEGFSPNDDNKNDWFNIQGLYNIFEQHELKIYNRLGTLIFKGDNQKRWDGYSNNGLNNGQLVPVGTYYYVLHLNDPNYKSVNGWVYVNY
ncbi:gliding motility-associated C-terminal domain-containing protein [Winogradskyella jejuensis]|uniref:Gliding motility-associated C-terminal domain-containing protein n=1 Tax=Winogradskyella jejuensis TaxID=1089305 RepID=A0A1M5JWG5_9FLAO|nr:gliding motility-associated C-terminal domain-containing protein [Winogradskyella jejuensis]SHG44921.1 gliding motility-associated C-terminal domain-containing protein [Winogradskyella jejuensis]